MNVDLIVIAGILLLLSVLLVRYFFRIAIIMVLAGVLLVYTGITVGDLRKIFSDPTSVDGNGTTTQSPSTTELFVANMGSSSSREKYLLKTGQSSSRNRRPREGMNGAPRESQGGVDLEPVPARLQPPQPFPAPRIFGKEAPQTRRMVKSYGDGEYSTRAAPPSMPAKEQRDLAREAAMTNNEVRKWEQARLLPLTAPPARRTFDSDFPPVYHHI